MLKKPYAFAIICVLLIPVATMAGATLSLGINPEIAAGHPDYERNYRLLDMAKNAGLLATLLAALGLGFLACFFLLKSKQRSYAWLFLAVFGPIGLIGLTMLGDKLPAPGDRHQKFVGNLGIYLRVAYELGIFVAVWFLAFQCVVLKRELMIRYESATTGVPAAQIVDVQNASSGMWAFSEGLQTLYLVVLLYLVWPICFSAMAHLPGRWASSRKA